MDDKASILNSIKKLHGITAADTGFDTDIIIHINSALMKLTQLGVGPVEGFYIEDATTTWLDYIPNPVIAESVKSYVYAKVRLIFDPPNSPTITEALKSAAKEDEWRIVAWAEQHAQ